MESGCQVDCMHAGLRALSLLMIIPNSSAEFILLMTSFEYCRKLMPVTSNVPPPNVIPQIPLGSILKNFGGKRVDKGQIATIKSSQR